jgi:uroporphyrinogen-III synthase
MRVVVTRPGPQAGKWVTALRAAGHEAVSLPLIEIAGPPEPQAVVDAWLRLQTFNAIMFVSANAVQQFFALRPDAVDVDALSAIAAPRFFVTGPGSAAALLKAGVPAAQIDAPDAAAAQFDSEALWHQVQQQVQPGWRVLIVRGNSDSSNGNHDGESGDEAAAGQGAGRDWLAARLTERGAAVEFLVAYARRAPPLTADALALLQGAAGDGTVWLFSSSEAVTNLCSMAAGQSWRQARALATHPRIAQAARAAGFGTVQESRPAMAELLASIESLT